MTEVIAHRGFHNHVPENTLPAFASALATNADAIEIDLHRTKDGYLVIIHDEIIDRTTNGHGFVKALTLAQIQTYATRNTNGPLFYDVQVPTFRDLLTYLAEKNFTRTLVIEVKTDKLNYPGIEQEILDTLAEFDPQYSVIFQSFNLNTLHTFRELAPTAEIAALTFIITPKVLMGRRRGDFDYIHPDITKLKSIPLMYALAKRIGHVRPWNVDQYADQQRLIRDGFAGLITNEVQKALALRDSIN